MLCLQHDGTQMQNLHQSYTLAAYANVTELKNMIDIRCALVYH